MNRADNQHRKRAIELLREDIHMADGPNEMFIGDFPYKDHVEAIVDAIMDAVRAEMERPLVWKGSPEDAQKILDAEDGKMVEITDFPVLSPSKTTPNQYSLDTPLET